MLLTKRSTHRLTAGLTLAVVALVAVPLAGQMSPRGTAELTLQGKKIAVEYGRPYRKGRKIMGGLVPYGEVWRTGASEATAFVTEADLEIGGTTVPKGAYTLYTLPSESTWKLIINKRPQKPGMAFDYDPSQDLVRLDLEKDMLSEPIEQFTISLERTGPDAGVLKLAWENALLAIPFKLKREGP